ncbi:MAG TPA: hypothetical protein VME67_26740 [Mycobacterium sp.]|nr:hypothetical protein [Mycobacterium sp.]HTX98113.1 hypothetical protein [Mycobacterium sp.]
MDAGSHPGLAPGFRRAHGSKLNLSSRAPEPRDWRCIRRRPCYGGVGHRRSRAAAAGEDRDDLTVLAVVARRLAGAKELARKDRVMLDAQLVDALKLLAPPNWVAWSHRPKTSPGTVINTD